MKLFKYWAPGEATVDAGRRTWKLRAYGSSNQSLDEAKRHAREVAERAAQAIVGGQATGPYGYADRPLREEIVEEIRNDGKLIGAITRNAYGSLILNTTQAMFVDVDYGPNKSAAASVGAGLKQIWARLTGRAAAESKLQPPNRDDALLERFQQVTESRGELGIRVYRTAGGFRILATSGPFEPASDAAERLLTDFGSDALYVRLCRAQQCFRARLTAKFWRCGAAKPPSRFPWSSPEEEADYRRWEQAYHERANRHATCAPIASFGESAVAAVIRPILEIHDRLTINEGAPLG